ncbi:MAG: hypothetical protein K6F39_01710 [Lachnospiraceae bacterium]|nr:hypothetical protein [Lachnospiraceae bacterium]
MISKRLRKSLTALLTAALVAATLVPVSAAETASSDSVSTDSAIETSTEEADTETVSDADAGESEVEVESTEDEEVDTQSTNAQVSGVTVSLDEPVYMKTGSAIKPTPHVTVSGTTVSAGTYTVSYHNNTKVGTAAVVVKGANKGDVKWTGTYSASFKIVKKKISLSSKEIKVLGVEDRQYTQSGNYKQDNVKVYYINPESGDYTELREGVDYTKTITGTSAANKKKMKVVITPASSSTIFKGKKTIKFRTYDKKKVLTDPDNITVSVSYNNKSLANYEAVDPVFKNSTSLALTKIKPSVTLTDSDGNKLTEGTDYKVTYKANKNPGIASIVVKLKKSGKQTYYGKLIRYFTIEPIEITSSMVTYCQTKSSSYTYTGDEIIPSMKVKVKINGKVRTLTQDTDYYVACINNVKKRSASATNPPTAYVFGMGKYQGYIGSDTFRIKK